MRLKTVLFLFICSICCMQAQEKVMMLVGTYTDGGSKGVYSFRFNQETGEAEMLDSLELRNPSYLTVSRDGHMIYAVSETNDKQASLNVVSFDQEGGMRLFASSSTPSNDNNNGSRQRGIYSSI